MDRYLTRNISFHCDADIAVQIKDQSFHIVPGTDPGYPSEDPARSVRLSVQPSGIRPVMPHAADGKRRVCVQSLLRRKLPYPFSLHAKSPCRRVKQYLYL